MHIILTHTPSIFSKSRLKDFAKKLLGKTRGPDAVLQSLTRGLDSISFPYKINQAIKPGDTVHVIRGIDALKYGIKLKSDGIIDKLVVGPNLVVIPTEHNSILTSPEIDSILIPSVWTKEFYTKLLPEVAHKIHIWPAGVKIPPIDTIITKRDTKCLIFKKKVPDKLYNSVCCELSRKNIAFTTLIYGNFNHSEYFEALRSARFMIYLQEVESQGLAIQEAWANNVPTLVWNSGSFQYYTGDIVCGNISAPYLTDKAGILFNSTDDFPTQLEYMLSHLSEFAPKEYCEKNLSDTASTQIYVKILQTK